MCAGITCPVTAFGSLVQAFTVLLGLWIITGAQGMLFEICPILPGPWLRVQTGSKCCLHMVLKHSLGLIPASHPCWQFSPAWQSLGSHWMCQWDGKSGCFSSLVPGTRLPASILIRGRRWGSVRASSCRSELKMLDVVPSQRPNLYSHLHLSPLFLFSSWACYSWAQAPMVRKEGH